MGALFWQGGLKKKVEAITKKNEKKGGVRKRIFRSSRSFCLPLPGLHVLGRRQALTSGSTQGVRPNDTNCASPPFFPGVAAEYIYTFLLFSSFARAEFFVRTPSFSHFFCWIITIGTKAVLGRQTLC